MVDRHRDDGWALGAAPPHLTAPEWPAAALELPPGNGPSGDRHSRRTGGRPFHRPRRAERGRVAVVRPPGARHDRLRTGHLSHRQQAASRLGRAGGGKRHRQQAAAWVTSQVSHGVIVACDPLMCAALQQRGFPAADLSPLTPSSPDPLGSGLVVATTAVRSQLGSRLGTVYAPVVIASFGSGADLVQVRIGAVGTATADLAAVRADMRARKFAGTELAGNKNLRMPARARAALAAGRVDSRLLITLGALTHRLQVRIVSIQRCRTGRRSGLAAATAHGGRSLRRLPKPAALVPAGAAASIAPARLATPSRPDDGSPDQVHRPQPHRAARRRSGTVTRAYAGHRPDPCPERDPE